MHTGPEVTLEQAELFRALPSQRLARVRPVLRERRFARHRILFFENEPAEFLWALRSGEVRLYKSSRDGSVTTLESLGPGEIFGALSALDQKAYPASAEAVTEGIAWRLPRRHFLRLMAEEPALAIEVLQIVSRRLHEAHDRLRSLAHDAAPARLARSLLRVARAGEAQVTRRALAEASGTTVETAIRVLRRFERAGVIRGDVGHVAVLDEPALRRLAGEREA